MINSTGEGIPSDGAVNAHDAKSCLIFFSVKELEPLEGGINVNETNRTRSLSCDKNFEKNTKTPFLCATKGKCRKTKGKGMIRIQDLDLECNLSTK